jgi:hypothetical protein
MEPGNKVGLQVGTEESEGIDVIRFKTFFKMSAIYTGLEIKEYGRRDPLC